MEEGKRGRGEVGVQDTSYNPAVSHLTPPGTASPHGPPLMAIWKHLEHRNIGLTMIPVRTRRPNKTRESGDRGEGGARGEGRHSGGELCYFEPSRAAS